MHFRQTLFWDTDVRKLDMQKNGQYIIERILRFGTDREVHWLVGHYPDKRIRSVVKHSRSIDPKTRALWLLLATK